MADQSEPTKNEDVSWVLDSLVGFLKGPVWNLPILNFIEQKSVIFEPEVDQSNDDLEAEYAIVFDDFKKLVDTLLASHMQDLGISPDQFEQACASAQDNLSSRLHSLLFEQIWAASNYRIFKRMMIRRNIDLQLQALELLGQKLNLSNEALANSSLASPQEVCAEESELMRNIIRVTEVPKKEETRAERSVPEEQQQSTSDPNLAEATGPEVKDKENVDADADKAASADNSGLDEEMIKQVEKMNAELDQEADLESVKSQPIIEQMLARQQSSADRPASSGTLERSNRKLSMIIGRKGEQINADELQKRQNYLRSQRDKLIELKRKERSKQIVKVGESELNASRPKSARAIKSTLSKSNSKEEDKSKGESVEWDEKSLAYRRTLASRLKAELIGSTLNGDK